MERLPEIVPVRPAITKNDVAFDWNQEEVKGYLEEVTKKYVGLVVTDENLEDMEKARREVVKFRTAIMKFKADGKRKLKEPADRFARQCDELIEVVTDVELPIASQLARYDQERRTRLFKSITREYQAKASSMGLDMTRWDLNFPDKWFNKTQKWSDTCCAIDSLIKNQLEEQKADEARAAAIAIKREYAKACVETENEKRQFHTPLDWLEVFPGMDAEGTDLEGISLREINETVTSAAEKRAALEAAAAAKPEPVQNAANEAQEPCEATGNEIHHEEAAEPVEADSRNSTKDLDTYLSVTIGFTAAKAAEKDVRAYVSYIEHSLIQRGAFPVVTIEELRRKS